MKYKILFTDLDDTLLNREMNISEENQDALARAAAAGVKIVICTGRAVFSMEHYLEPLHLQGDDMLAICLNGAAVYNANTKKLVREKVFPKEIYHPVISCAHRYHS